MGLDADMDAGVDFRTGSTGLDEKGFPVGWFSRLIDSLCGFLIF
jgi:hypothetical protein